MQFAGLRSLLKKPEGQTATPSSSATTATTMTAKTAPADPYAMAIQTARAHQASFSTVDAQPAPQADTSHVTTTMASLAEQEKQHEETRKRGRSADAQEEEEDKTAAKDDGVALYSRAELEARREQAVHALQAVMRHMAHVWHVQAGDTKHEHTTRKTTDAHDAEHGGGHSSHATALCLPRALQDYMHTHFIVEDGGQESGSRAGPVSREEEDEQQLLLAIHDEVEDKVTTVAVAASSSSNAIEPASPRAVAEDTKEEEETSEACVGLAELLHTLWFLLASHWLGALQGGSNENSKTQTIRGWCYEAYLLACHAMSAEQKLQCGAVAAAALEKWNAARRTRRHTLELMAYLLHDYHALHAKAAASAEKDKGRTTIVPDSLRSGLVAMMVRHVRAAQDYGAARQDYADLTLGNANWKLGLFSAGEVHMRRSIARVERNRIAHLLNNEHAVQLLHAVRELMRHAERGLDTEERAMFFAL